MTAPHVGSQIVIKESLINNNVILFVTCYNKGFKACQIVMQKTYQQGKI